MHVLRRLFGWRQPKSPDISGCWAFAGEALNSDGSLMYAWNAIVTIDQDGAGVRVTVETERSQSRSISRTATLRRENDGRVALIYDCGSDPTHEGTANHAFFGVTMFLFAPDLQSAEGHYFNYNGRYTFGTMILTRA